MAGRPHKAPNALAGHRAERKPAPLRALAGGKRGPECSNCRELRHRCDLHVPPLPTGIRFQATKVRWREMWRSDVSGHWDERAHMGALTRYILLHDQWHWARAAVRKEPTVEGSKGQPRINPLAAELPKIEVMMGRLEDQLGLTPLAALRLGWVGGAAGGERSIEALNASLNAIGDIDPSEEPDSDGIWGAL